MNYEEHATAALKNSAAKDPATRYRLVDAVGELNVQRVLDLGCGPGQELIPFLERTGAFCVGIDIAPELGKVTREVVASSRLMIRATTKAFAGSCSAETMRGSTGGTSMSPIEK